MTSTFEAASFEVDLDGVEAWSAELAEDEIETIISAHNHDTDTEVKFNTDVITKGQKWNVMKKVMITNL